MPKSAIATSRLADLDGCFMLADSRSSRLREPARHISPTSSRFPPPSPSPSRPLALPRVPIFAHGSYRELAKIENPREREREASVPAGGFRCLPSSVLLLFLDLDSEFSSLRDNPVGYSSRGDRGIETSAVTFLSSALLLDDDVSSVGIKTLASRGYPQSLQSALFNPQRFVRIKLFRWRG